MFDREDDVYNHMTREHGSFFANRQEEREATEHAMRLAQIDEDRLGLQRFAEIAQEIGQPVRFAQPDLIMAALGLVHPRPLEGPARHPPAPRAQEAVDAQLARQEAFAGWFW